MVTNRAAKHNERTAMNLMYGTYSDVLFILFPFLVIALQRVWNGEGIEILQQPDLSVASAILAGMSVGKFVLGLISDDRMSQYRERIVFFIAVTIFFVMGPSLMLITKMVGASEVPKFVIFIQPIVLIIAISVYTVAIGISRMLNKDSDDEELSDNAVARPDAPEPIKIDTPDTTNKQ
ncbi:MAG: hypothetical protein H7A01_11280 [Hahellaceae bacterium]|jgi:uncharacterized membrane protein|nr:hypothetical protein [Hahellaceae bacterium]MCP5210102.1 hypothetical protein [Hahellaceae bacterium]